MHPILIELGALRVPTYGALLVAGFLLGLLLVQQRAPALGLDPGRMAELAALLVIGGSLGSRLWYAAEGWTRLREQPWRAFALWEGGAVWYGGLLGGLTALAWSWWRTRAPAADLADLFFPAASLAHLCGRLGCFAAGCCWGEPTHLPWAVVFPAGSACQVPGVPLHPTQLYEAAGEGVISLVLLALWRRPGRVPGEVGLAYLVLYPVLRFAIEPLRGDPGRILLFAGRLSAAQVVSVLLAALAGTAWWRLRRRG